MISKPLAIAYKPFRAMNVNTSKARSFYTQGQQFAARVLCIVWLLASGSPEGALATSKRQPAMVPATTTSPGDPSLASTPPTLPPGGILQLPPDSPGSFWGDSVGSSPAMQSALQQRMGQEAAPDKGGDLLRTSPKVTSVEEHLSFQARGGESVRFHYQMGQWCAEVSSHIGSASRRVVLPVVCSQGEAIASRLEVLSKYPSWHSQRQIHVLDRNVCPTLGEVVCVGELGLKGGGEEECIPGPSVNVGNVDEEGAIKCDIPEGKRYKRHEVDVESSEEGVSYTVEYVEAASETLLQRYAQSSRSSSGGGHLSAHVLETFGAGVSGDIHRSASSSADRLYIGRHSHAAVVVRYKTTKWRPGLLRKAGNAMCISQHQPTYLNLQVRVQVSDKPNGVSQSQPSDPGGAPPSATEGVAQSRPADPGGAPPSAPDGVLQLQPLDPGGAAPSLSQSLLDWLQEQIAAGTTPDAVYSLIAERLEDPKQPFTRSDCVRYGRVNAEAMIDHDKIGSLRSSSRERISSWFKEQEGKFRWQYSARKFSEAASLLSVLRELATSLGFSDLDFSSLRAELDSARQDYESQQAQASALEGQLSSLREALSQNADKVETNHAEVQGLFSKHQQYISDQLASQESTFEGRIEILTKQQSEQKAFYESRLSELKASYVSELSRQEAEIRQDARLSAEQREAALLALQRDLELRYKSEQQAQEARHSQALARLAAERSDAESALHAEKGRLLAEQKQSYEKLLFDLEGELGKLRGSLSSYQSELSSQKHRHAQVLSELAVERSKLQGALETSQSELEAQRSLYSKALSDLAAEQSKLQDDLETSQSELEAQRIRHSEALSDLAAERSSSAKLQDDLEASQSELEAQRSLYSKTFSELAVERASLESAHGQLKAQEAELEQLREELARAILSSRGDSVLDASLWERYYGAVGSVPSPPSGIDQILNSPCPFWRGKQVKETHLLALIPSHVGGKPLTLDYLGELIQSPKGGGHKTQYRDHEYYSKYVRPAIGHQSPDSSYWVLMTKDVLPESRNKRYEDQCALVADHANRTGLAYEVPGALEVAVLMLLHHVRSGERLYRDGILAWTYTRCREKVQGYPVVVGGFSSGGLYVSDDYDYSHYGSGVAGLRKF